MFDLDHLTCQQADTLKQKSLSPLQVNRCTCSNTLILALGNPHRGDDGVGLAVLDALSSSDQFAQNATLVDGSRGDLLNILISQDFERVIIIDAAQIGRSPGDWARFTLENIELGCVDYGTSTTLHNAGLAEALALANALGLVIPEMVIYGVQPFKMGWKIGLSRPVEVAVLEVKAAILEEINDNNKTGTSIAVSSPVVDQELENQET